MEINWEKFNRQDSEPVKIHQYPIEVGSLVKQAKVNI
jgi:hypothetical protein